MNDPRTTTDQPFETGVARPAQDPPVGELVHRVRSELRLAQAELAQKGKRAGLGIGMFSVAGLLAFFAMATLIATAVVALDLVLPLWASGLIVAAVLLVGALGAALGGRNEIQQATPAAPEHAIAGVKQDVAALKGESR
jgi:uncharacterized membrane protein YqjE